MRNSKIETWIGIGLLIIVIVAFILELIFSLPKGAAVTAKARVVPTIPRDLFASTNPLNKQVSQLNVPSNVPVNVQPSEVGRDNVFAGF
ncbi:MAG TPA: hypothetical protein VLE93_02215 [Candidatus Saccharimonadales bacterium]|nr:hypothetical protein [Candidatus Saccharimonadales bacterium]